MNRIDSRALPALRQALDIETFAYDRSRRGVGIVHFGIGAFHRAHQAWYTDRAMDAAGGDWMIAGVSLRSPGVKDQLAPQDGLYSVTQRGEGKAFARIVGAVRDVLVAGPDRGSIVDAIAAPACRIVSFTVTEKGYCRSPNGALDHGLAEAGFYPLLADALERRRGDGLPGLTLLSCDNLSANGEVLGTLMRDYLANRSPALANWFAAECACPSTMVDRIVPATTAGDLDRTQAVLGGLRDEGAVMTEPFSQWVIEDRFAGSRPAWDMVGAELVADVAPYETAKLRMLNGAHSLLAYCGLARGLTFVHEAVADPALRALAERLMRDEAAPTIDAAPGQDLAGYASALLERFANAALEHRLMQIAMDGSQKIPQRWLATLAHHQREGRTCPSILAGIADWLRHVRGDNGPVDDPLAAQMARAWEDPGLEGIIDAFFAPGGIIASDWLPDGEAGAVILEHLRQR